jgi:dephospho-CoA kinase
MALTMTRKVVAIVGMPGAGKSEVARVFESNGFTRIRFGDLTDREIKARGLELNEHNERLVRESLRREHGMAAYARLNLPTIDPALKQADVVIDGLYSWEEYLVLRDHYAEAFRVVAVWTSPATRYARLSKRKVRPLNTEEAAGRDKAEIENVNKGGPIAMADFTILNELSLESLKQATEKVVAALK